MKLIKKENKKKETRSLPMNKKSRSAFAVYAALVFMLCCCTTTAFAASDPLTVINNLSDFIFGLIRAVGMILLGFGVVQIGLSLKSHDPSQRANGFLTLAGGVCLRHCPPAAGARRTISENMAVRGRVTAARPLPLPERR